MVMPTDDAPPVHEISVSDLKSMMDRGDRFELIDVRTPAERERAVIEGSRLLDQSVYDELLQADLDARIVFCCHHGERSRQAAEHFRQRGFTNLFNVHGGIDAWSQLIDPRVPRY